MRFSDLFSRADDEVIQSFLGAHAVRLIRLVDPSTNLSRLRQIAMELISPAGLLLDPIHRTELLDLLRITEARFLLQLLNVVDVQDPFSYLRTFRCNRGSEKERILFDFFEVPIPPIEQKISLPTVEQHEPAYPLFPHQRRAVRDIVTTLAQAPYRAVLHMPTGSGKTRTAMNIIAEHLRGDENRVVVWLAYSEELCEQAVEEFTKAWRYLGDREIPVIRYWGSHTPNFNGLRDGFVVAGLSKMYNTLKTNSRPITDLGGQCSLVVIDEAHQAVAETYQLVLEIMFGVGRPAALLGLTATPGRTWADLDEDQRLADFFGQKKVMLHIPDFDNPVQYLIQEQFLARTEFRALNYEGGIELSPTDLRSIQEDLDIPDRILKKLADDDQRNLKILVELSQLVHHHDRTLVFAASVAHADVLATVLRARGIDAHSLSGGTPGPERARLIADFKSDKPGSKVLVNYGVLTTGFDAPQTSAVLIARPTKSLVLYSQMVGRAIRGLRAGGNAEAEVVTVVDQALPGFGSVADAFLNWEDVWKS